MPLDVPPLNEDGSLRYYTTSELAQIDIKRRGVTGEGDHIIEEFNPEQPAGPRRYTVEWDERYAAMLVFLGYTKDYTVGGVKKISRLLPDSHPAFGQFNWIATALTIHPYRYTGTIAQSDFGQSLPNFTRAELTVQYQLVPFHLLDDDEVQEEYGELLRYVTEPGFVPGGEITSETNVITFPGGALNFCTADGTTRPAKVAIPYNIGFPETITRKRVLWRRVPQDIWGPDKPLTQMVKGNGTTRGYIGSLNKTEIWGHPPLTLKLEGVEEKLMPDPTGLAHAWDLTYVFAEAARPFGWTGLYFFETGTGGGAVASGYYQALLNKTSTNKTAAQLAADDSLPLFQVREHKNLFVPGGV